MEKIKIVALVGGLILGGLISGLILKPQKKPFALDAPSAEDWKAAEEALKSPGYATFFADEEMRKLYSIKNAEEGKTAAIGEPYLLYAINDLQKLADYSSEQKVSSLITPTKTWYFTVLVNDQPCVDLNISQPLVGQWRVGKMGGTFTKEIDQLEKEVADECSLKLVNIPSMEVFFVLEECADREFVIVLTPTDWLELEEKKLYPAEEAMPNFAEEAKKKLGGGPKVGS